MNVLTLSSHDSSKPSSLVEKIRKTVSFSTNKKIQDIAVKSLKTSDSFRLTSQKASFSDLTKIRLSYEKFYQETKITTESEFILVFDELLNSLEFSHAEKLLEDMACQIMNNDPCKMDEYHFRIFKACLLNKKISEGFLVLKKIQTEKNAFQAIEYSIKTSCDQSTFDLIERKILKIQNPHFRSWGVFKLFEHYIYKNKYIYAESLLGFIIDPQIYSNSRFFLFSHFFDNGMLTTAESTISSIRDLSLEQFAYKKIFDRYFKLKRTRDCFRIFTLIDPSSTYYNNVFRKMSSLSSSVRKILEKFKN